jgi:hypothetical protein
MVPVQPIARAPPLKTATQIVQQRLRSLRTDDICVRTSFALSSPCIQSLWPDKKRRRRCGSGVVLPRSPNGGRPFPADVAAGQHPTKAPRFVVTWACISLSAQGPDQVEAFLPQGSRGRRLDTPIGCCTLTLFLTMVCNNRALVWNERGTHSALEGGVSKATRRCTHDEQHA